MALPIEDYALIGDTQSAALVGRDGSIDWLCLPRFDSDACFTALLGDDRHGRWRLAPSVEVTHIERRYVPETLVLETRFRTAGGEVKLTDFMPIRGRHADVVRVLEGVFGTVPIAMELRPRFGYGTRTPWFERSADETTVSALAGPDAVAFQSEVPFRCEHGAIRSEFSIAAGQRVRFALVWHPSNEPVGSLVSCEALLDETIEHWQRWSARCTTAGPLREPVLRSLITLKALTYSPTGGIVAAPTTSLPEQIGGVRNWDYRYCWVRDATFTLLALMDAGFRDEAHAWRDWLMRTVAGEPSEFQIMYGVAGEHRLTEIELEWLPGYEHSTPVRIGNAAADQVQLDVWGEVMDCLHTARVNGMETSTSAWRLQQGLMSFMEENWHLPDEGIWETRGPRMHFTHSKVMAWVAVDRAIRSVERFGLPGPIDRWRRLRRDIHAEVCEKGYDRTRNSFIQTYGSRSLDASLLLIPVVGFLPPDDERVLGTIAAIERELCEDGLVHRYDTRATHDGLPPGEGVFLACSFWLADALLLTGRKRDASRLIERLMSLRNDVGLLSEEYDPVRKRLVGNFPQALSHVALVNSALSLTRQHEEAAPGRGEGADGEPGSAS